MMAPDVAEALLSDKDMRKQFTSIGGQLIAGESAIRIQAQILAEQRQRQQEAAKAQQAQQAAQAEAATKQQAADKAAAQQRSQAGTSNADYSQVDANIAAQRSTRAEIARERAQASSWLGRSWADFKDNAYEVAYNLKGTALMIGADPSKAVNDGAKLIADSGKVVAANAVDLAGRYAKVSGDLIDGFSGNKPGTDQTSASLMKLRDSLLASAGADQNALMSQFVPKAIDKGLTAVQQGADASITYLSRQAANGAQYLDAQTGLNISADLTNFADRAERSPSITAELAKDVGEFKDQKMKQVYAYVDDVGTGNKWYSPVLGAAMYTATKVLDTGADLALGGARMAVDSEYRHEKIETFEKLEAVQSTAHLFGQGVRTAVNGAASGAMIAVGGVVAATGNTETADNIFGAATDLRNDERFQPIRQDEYAKAVHMVGGIAVTVATMPAGGAGLVFGGLQSINSASAKIEHGASTESALASVGIDLTAMAVGGALNTAALGKAVRMGAPAGGAIGRAEQAVARVMQGEGRVASALNAISGNKAQAVAGLAVDVGSMAAKNELTANDFATSAAFNALGAMIGGRRGVHMPEGPAPRSAHGDVTPEVRVGRAADVEPVMPGRASDSQTPGAVTPNRVSADDLLGALPARQVAEPQVNVAAIVKPASTPDPVALPDPVVSRPVSVDPVVTHPASVDPVVTPVHVDPTTATPAHIDPTTPASSTIPAVWKEARQLKADGKNWAERQMVLRYGVNEPENYARPITRDQFHEHVANNDIKFNQPIDKVYNEQYAVPKADRADPATYLDSDYAKNLHGQFENGAARLDHVSNFDKFNQPKIDAGEPFGRPGKDGNFVAPKDDIGKLYAKNDPVLAERTLGLNDGYYSNNGGMVMTTVEKPGALDMRLPTGREPGAYAEWLPGGKTWNKGKAGMTETVVNEMSLNHPSAEISIHRDGQVFNTKLNEIREQRKSDPAARLAYLADDTMPGGGGKARWGEAKTAFDIEENYGYFGRYTRDMNDPNAKKGDFISLSGPYKGKTFDDFGSEISDGMIRQLNSKKKAKEEKAFLSSLQTHLDDADHVILNLTHLKANAPSLYDKAMEKVLNHPNASQVIDVTK